MTTTYEYIAKLVVIGDSGTGKSSLTIRLSEDRFVQQHDVTIGVEFGSRVVPVGKRPCRPVTTSESTSEVSKWQKHMKLSLWDTAGQETYKSITRSYFRGASGALLVFDISRRATFHSVTAWLHDLRQIAEDDMVIILIGNKADLAQSSTKDEGSKFQNRRQVTQEEAWEWCKANGIFNYVETSAKTGDGVEEAFLEVANKIYENIEAGKYDLNDRRSGVKNSRLVNKNRSGNSEIDLGKDARQAQKVKAQQRPCC